MFCLLKASNCGIQKFDEFLGSYLRIARHPKNLLHENKDNFHWVYPKFGMHPEGKEFVTLRKGGIKINRSVKTGRE